jgi:hypothetical protein
MADVTFQEAASKAKAAELEHEVELLHKMETARAGEEPGNAMAAPKESTPASEGKMPRAAGPAVLPAEWRAIEDELARLRKALADADNEKQLLLDRNAVLQEECRLLHAAPDIASVSKGAVAAAASDSTGGASAAVQLSSVESGEAQKAMLSEARHSLEGTRQLLAEAEQQIALLQKETVECAERERAAVARISDLEKEVQLVSSSSTASAPSSIPARAPQVTPPAPAHEPPTPDTGILSSPCAQLDESQAQLADARKHAEEGKMKVADLEKELSIMHKEMDLFAGATSASSGEGARGSRRDVGTSVAVVSEKGGASPSPLDRHVQDLEEKLQEAIQREALAAEGLKTLESELVTVSRTPVVEAKAPAQSASEAEKRADEERRREMMTKAGEGKQKEELAQYRQQLGEQNEELVKLRAWLACSRSRKNGSLKPRKLPVSASHLPNPKLDYFSGQLMRLPPSGAKETAERVGTRWVLLLQMPAWNAGPSTDLPITRLLPPPMFRFPVRLPLPRARPRSCATPGLSSAVGSSSSKNWRKGKLDQRPRSRSCPESWIWCNTRGMRLWNARRRLLQFPNRRTMLPYQTVRQTLSRSRSSRVRLLTCTN